MIDSVGLENLAYKFHAPNMKIKKNPPLALPQEDFFQSSLLKHGIRAKCSQPMLWIVVYTTSSVFWKLLNMAIWFCTQDYFFLFDTGFFPLKTPH